MNNMPYPYIIPHFNQMPQTPNQDELTKLKYEVERLKERVNALEQKDKKNYLKKEEGLYMM